MGYINEINVKLLKENAVICASILTRIFNSCITDGVFPDKLKLADISPIFKSIDSMAKENYRPVSILNSVSKIFEKPIQKQLNPVFDKKLRDDVHTHFVTLIVKWTIVGGWVKPLDDKRGKVGTIKSPKNLG